MRGCSHGRVRAVTAELPAGALTRRSCKRQFSSFFPLIKKSALSTVPGRLVWQRIKRAASRSNFARFNRQMEIVCFHNATSILRFRSEAAVPPKAIRRNKMTLCVCTSIYDRGSFLPRANSSCVAAPGPFPPPCWCEVGRGFA